MTSIVFDSPWINWAAIIHETNDVVIAEIDLNADGKNKQPSAYLTDKSNSYIYFQKGHVKFHDLPFENSLTFAETSSGTCYVCIMKRPENSTNYRFFENANNKS
jgi:hypothetical protein